MAASPASNRTTCDNNSFSYFRKTVTLHDWWLIKANPDSQGRSLAVAGFTSREQRPLRMFCSAPITKRYDVFSLETADGVTVLLQGFINKIRTTENGFSPEVFNDFLFGFPPSWEECTKKYLGQAVNSGMDFQSTFDFNKSTADQVSAVMGTKGSSPISTPSKHKSIGETVLRCIDEKTTYEDFLSRSPIVGDSNILNQSESHLEESTPLATVQSGVGANVVTLSTVEKDTMNASPSNSGCRKNSNPLINLKNNQRQKHVSECSVKHKTKELISEASEHQDGGNPKGSSRTTLHSSAHEVVSEAMLKTARRLKKLSGDLKSEEKNEHIAAEEGGSPRKNAKRKIFFDMHASPLTQEREERICIRSPDSLSLKRSRSGRLLLPSLDFWRNQIPVYDANRNITGIQEELDAVKPSEGSKSATQKKRNRR